MFMFLLPKHTVRGDFFIPKGLKLLLRRTLSQEETVARFQISGQNSGVF